MLRLIERAAMHFIHWITRRRPWFPKEEDEESVVKDIKMTVQYLIGTALMVGITWIVFGHWSDVWQVPNPVELGHVAVLPPSLVQRVLGLVSIALSISAGVELAYMLFTPGVDEAFEPVVVAIAAGILLYVSKDEKWSIHGAAVVLLFVISMVGPLAVKLALIKPQKAKN